MKEMICFVKEGQPDRPAQPEQCEALLCAIRRHFPHTITWAQPQESAFLEVVLPKEMSARQFLSWSEGEKVTFSLEQDNKVHLHFHHLEPTQIEEGLRRLGRVFTHYLHLAITNNRAMRSYFLGP